MSTNISSHHLSTRNILHLNRNLKDVVVLDYSKENYHLQPENVVVINQFDGEKNDDALSHASNLLKCKRMKGKKFIFAFN